MKSCTLFKQKQRLPSTPGNRIVADIAEIQTGKSLVMLTTLDEIAFDETRSPAQTTTDRTVIAQTHAFWHHFYAKSDNGSMLRQAPSPFARWCLETQLSAKSRLLELGCGNGRDSFAFLQQGLSVLAVDGCEVAIGNSRAHYAAQKPTGQGSFHAVNFAELDQLTEIASDQLCQINTLYTRFVLHAIPEVLEDKLLAFAYDILPPGGRMLHEFRTIHDPLMRKGEALSSNERLTDHYRRFLDADTFRTKLSDTGWREVFFIEAKGLATYGDDDPVVARVVAEKTSI